MFNRILVPTDFSPPSSAALEYARMLAATFGSSLWILHVVDDPSASSEFVADGFAPSTDDIRHSLLNDAHTRLEPLATRIKRVLPNTHADAVIGLPAPSIVDYAFATTTDLIVMGTHGRTGLAHLLMGSVAEQVVRTAPCPVLTVRQVQTAERPAVDVANLRLPIAV